MSLLIANLDCEVTFAREAGRTLSAEVQVHVARAAEHMRAFGEAGDEVVSSDALAALSEPPAELLAWGETEAVARLRRRPAGGPCDDAVPVVRAPLSAEWRARLWQLYPRPEIARLCNDKRFAFELARRHGWSLPGSAIVASREEIDDAIAALPQGSSARWVLKAPYSAAGRERLRRRGPLDGEHAAHASRLLKRFGSLIFEPWVERSFDAAVCGIAAPHALLLLPPHRQENDGAGVCRSVTVGGEVPNTERLLAAAETTGRHLLANGYVGPFTIDAFRYSNHPDGEAWQLLSEINARLSFGLCAHAQALRAEKSGEPQGGSRALSLSIAAPTQR